MPLPAFPPDLLPRTERYHRRRELPVALRMPLRGKVGSFLLQAVFLARGHVVGQDGRAVTLDIRAGNQMKAVARVQPLDQRLHQVLQEKIIFVVLDRAPENRSAGRKILEERGLFDVEHGQAGFPESPVLFALLFLPARFVVVIIAVVFNDQIRDGR